MAELNLKQITDKLNSEFASDTRKLVFWYDDKAEFAEDIDTLELIGAKLYKLEPDHQFYTKYFLERQDCTTSYLIYAPFPKPSPRENHLEDTLRYSKQFYADRASLLTMDLGIEEKYKPIIQKHIKFFAAKDRTQKFYDLEIENFSKETIEVALMSVVCRTRTASFDEVLRVVLMDDGFEENKYLTEIEKYDLLPAFWQLCDEQLGYSDPKPTLEKLVLTLFVTYTARYLHGSMPTAWEGYVSYKSGSTIAFMDNLMNNVLYRERYDEIAEGVSKGLNVIAALEGYDAEAVLDCDTFAVLDTLILNWLLERLINEDTGAKLANLDIPAICQKRMKMHFGSRYREQYQMLAHAFHIILSGNYKCPSDVKSIVAQYQTADYHIDSHYRHFYYCYDQLSDTSDYEKLRDLVENIYTNEYLAKVLPRWNAALKADDALAVLPLQRNFYNAYVKTSKDRVVVIISDALRYEVGQTLLQKLQDDEKCTAKLEPMMGVLPSYTRLGMAALLPHGTLEITDEYKVLVDGLPSESLPQRETILKNYVPNGRCVQFDDIRLMKKEQLRDVFTGMEVVYVYHNQIDARGDKVNTENEVFNACQEAVEEIYSLIKRISVNANTTHFIITADHGFLYKRDKLGESDKITNAASKGDFINRRFVVSKTSIEDDGVASEKLSRILGNSDDKVISYPISTNVFKVPGGGQNYVHGGSSPQEMMVPVIDVKTEKGRMETKTVQIVLVSMVHKITNLIASLDFIQSEPVSDVIKATTYRLYFISEDGEKISNECLYTADVRDADPQMRIFRLKFNFKNKQYDKAKKYYLVAYDDKNNLEIIRHSVIMDLAFANDFGFRV